MIERYTIKFASAVSQKELEKALHETGETPNANVPDLHKLKCRIEFVGDFEDVKKLTGILRELSQAE